MRDGSLRMPRGAGWLCALGLACASTVGHGDEKHEGNEPRVLLVIVNRARPESDIPSKHLVQIFRGEIRFWGNADRIHPVLPPEDSSEARQRFLQSVVRLSPAEFNLHWKARLFRGEDTTAPLSLPSAKDCGRLVFESRGSLAIVEANAIPNLEAVAKVLTVDDKPAQDPAYPLKW